MFFFILIFIVHLQAVIIPMILGFKSINQFKSINKPYLIPFGFTSFGLAAMFEMMDHFQTQWIYLNHASIFNWLFYTFLSCGLTLFSVSIIRNKYLPFLNLTIFFLGIISYWLFGKSYSLIFQVILSIFLIIFWQKKFKDWLLLSYPVFGIFLTTFFGIKLSLTGNQIWHIFIGPSGTLSVFSFFLVLERYQKKQ